MCDDVYLLIDDVEYMTVKCKWQAILTDIGNNDFNEWMSLVSSVTNQNV